MVVSVDLLRESLTNRPFSQPSTRAVWIRLISGDGRVERMRGGGVSTKVQASGICGTTHWVGSWRPSEGFT
jgi:hypothetical protein